MKAVVLLSGGLDSTLAAEIVKKLGVEVKGVNFKTPFFDSRAALSCARKLNISLKEIDLSTPFLEIIKSPAFWKNMNPCVECRTLLLREAKKYMEEEGASFLVTGEVLGEKPKSQSRDALREAEKRSGTEGFVLRPLSAKLLPPTIPEKEGKVKRERLFSIHGRNRSPQLELAKQFGVKRFPTSGCYLTNPCFSRRLRDAIKHKDLTISDIHLLKMGRHFRVSRKVKVIIGRNKDENKRLPTFLQPGDLLIWPEHHKGATAILNGEIDKEVDILKVAALCARYSEGKNLPSVKMNIKFSKKTREVAVVKPKDASSLSFAMI